MTAANFARLDVSPEVSQLVTAMPQARQAVAQRSWSHPQEESPDDWWADVLADPRARRQTRGNHSRGALNIYRLQDEPRATVLVACTKSLGRRHHQVRKLRQEVGKKKGEGRRQDDSKR